LKVQMNEAMRVREVEMGVTDTKLTTSTG